MWSFFMPRIVPDIHITDTRIQEANQMNHLSAYTPRTHQQQSEIRASTSKGCIATRAADAELTAAPLPPATASGRLSLISIWLSTLPPIDAAKFCQSASPQSPRARTDAPLRL